MIPSNNSSRRQRLFSERNDALEPLEQNALGRRRTNPIVIDDSEPGRERTNPIVIDASDRALTNSEFTAARRQHDANIDAQCARRSELYRQQFEHLREATALERQRRESMYDDWRREIDAHNALVRQIRQEHAPELAVARERQLAREREENFINLAFAREGRHTNFEP